MSKEKNIEQIKKTIADLCREIEFHNKKYYEEDSPVISDFEYDALYKKLEDLERKYPELVPADSPTKRVGGMNNSKFSSVEHLVPMQSLHDSFSYEEIRDFIKRVKAKLSTDVSYVVEPKIDGLSVSLEYKDGVFFRGSTRGTGLVGEDVTENIAVIKSVPLRLKEKVPYLEVRGEVYITDENFLNLVNIQKEKCEKNIFKNPRNAAAGSLRQKDSSITKTRNLDLIIFNVQKIIGKTLLEHKESINYLKYLGFNTIPNSELCRNFDEIIKEIEEIGESRGNYSFPLDGAVVKVNSFKYRDLLGTTAKFPRWAEAFKYPPEEKETKLLDIKFNVGRTGVITPVAVFEPVILAGTTINRATLHNEDFIKEKDIKINDIILVRKAGEIIPEVVGIKEHTKDSKDFLMPKFCPSCGSLLIRDEDEAAIRCTDANCPAQLLRNLIHFASKNAMDIEGLGPSIIEELINKKLIKNINDIYNLAEQDLMMLPRVNEKSAFKLVGAINKSKNVKLSNLIYALGIRNVGLETARLLEKHFKNLNELKMSDFETLKNIHGLGEIIAKNINNYFKLPENQELIEKLVKAGVNPQSSADFGKKQPTSTGKLNNETFAITGSLVKYTRDEITNIILNAGGKVVKSISKKTNYLLVGESPGSKLKKANELGIKIITEEELLNILS